MSEHWLPVVGFEGLYEVSDLGRIRSIDRIVSSGKQWRGRIRRAYRSKADRRLSIVLYRASRPTTRRVHRLVLEAFCGLCPEGMEACHYPDNDPSNCRLDNLRWDTPISNHADKIVHGTTNRGERHGMSWLIATDIERIFDLRRHGCTQQQISNWLGPHRATVSKVLRGERWGHLGFTPC